MPLLIGIDPGTKGAWCAISGFDARPVDWGTFVDGYSGMIEGLKKILPFFESAEALVEKALILGHQSPTNQGKFHTQYGIAQGVLSALGVEYKTIAPSSWKAKMGVTRDKETSRALAIELHPELAHCFKRKKDADLAEAFLIARHLFRLRTKKS